MKNFISVEDVEDIGHLVDSALLMKKDPLSFNDL